jgi:hypothetical protein
MSSVAHPASYQMGTETLSAIVRQPEREADHSSPSNAEVDDGNYTSTPTYVFIAWYGDNFTITTWNISDYLQVIKSDLSEYEVMYNLGEIPVHCKVL